MANEKAQASCNSILHRNIRCCIDRNTNQIKCNDETSKKKIQLFYAYIVLFVYALDCVTCPMSMTTIWM